ncbi:MAG: hypothetical protein ACOH10_01735 [Rhodoglobus sp.]
MRSDNHSWRHLGGMPDWSVIEVPGSQDFFGTGKSVRSNTTVDGDEVAVVVAR